MMKRLRMLKTLGSAMVIIGLAVSPALSVEPPDFPGLYKVGHREATLVDPARANRTLEVQIWYPAQGISWLLEPDFTFTPLVLTAGITSPAAKDDLPLINGASYPLIVFSHGFGGFNIQSLSLMEHLASHGFVVVAPNHTGNTQDDSSSPDPEADRYPDIAFTIAEMAAANLDNASPFFGHIDATNVGVAGHSYGGLTALFMATGYGAWPADPRVKAIMPISPSASALSDAQLQTITLPTLLLVGTLDGLQTQTERAYDLISSAPDLFRVEVIDANHTHFAGVCDIANVLIENGITVDLWEAVGAAALIPIYYSTCIPPAFSIEEATRLQNLYAAAHFKRYLLNDSDYADYLTASHAETEPDVLFFPEPPVVEAPLLTVLTQIGLVLGLVTLGAHRLRARGHRPRL